VGCELYLLVQRIRAGSRAAEAPRAVERPELGLPAERGPDFVLFTQPACRPCTSARRVLDSIVESEDGGATIATVDAIERSDLAIRYGVRAVPTILLVAKDGRVVRRWTRVPRPDDVRAALGES
jgi:thioredoxin 1